MASLPTWEQLEAAAPQVVDTMRRFLQQIGCILRPGSVKNTDLALRAFAGFLTQAAPEVVGVAQVTRAHIEAYKPWLAARPGQNKPRATTLASIEREISFPGEQVDVRRRINVDQALADLRYTATDLVELTHTSAQLPEPLIRSEVLFAPARILPSTMERVHDRNHGRYVPIQLKEGAALIDAAQQGFNASRDVRAALEISLRPVETTDPSAQTLASRLSRQEMAPAAASSELDLF